MLMAVGVQRKNRNSCLIVASFDYVNLSSMVSNVVSKLVVKYSGSSALYACSRVSGFNGFAGKAVKFNGGF